MAYQKMKICLSSDTLKILHHVLNDAPLHTAYLQHHTEWLKRVVPPSRLYFVNVKDGWEPLCKLLNLPVPSEPFPRVNEAEAMNDLKLWMMRTVLLRWGLILGPGLAAFISVVWFVAR
jgi:hypothetical protein